MKPGRQSFFEQLEAFEQDGNAVSSKPVTADKACSLRWRGTGSILEFGTNCGLRGVALDLEGGARVKLGADTVIRGSINVTAGSFLAIGDGTFVRRPCVFFALEKRSITIGKNCLFSDVDVRTSDMHAIFDKQTHQRLNEAQDVIIGNHVWLAAGVTVLRGVRIGNGSVIGAKSLVRDEIPEDVLAAGIPAQVVRTGICWSRKLAPTDAELAVILQG